MKKKGPKETRQGGLVISFLVLTAVICAREPIFLH